MPIIAKNIKVGGVQPPPTVESKASLKNIKDHIRKELEAKAKEAAKKDLSTRVNLNPPQVTKQLPKYVSKEEGELTTKINTKSQYMRDIFDLDS